MDTGLDVDVVDSGSDVDFVDNRSDVDAVDTESDVDAVDTASVLDAEGDVVLGASEVVDKGAALADVVLLLADTTGEGELRMLVEAGSVVRAVVGVEVAAILLGVMTGPVLVKAVP